jgi:dihydrofolate reductase
MRIVASDFMSLDGVVQAPGGRDEDPSGGFAHGGWSMPYFDEEAMGPVIDAAMARTEALLFGRRTWQGMAAAWPERAGDPFADRMNALPKYVASRTLQQGDLHWHNSTLLPPEDVIGAIRELRDRDGGDLQVLGSPTLASHLVAHGLVDEYRLMVEPTCSAAASACSPRTGRLDRSSSSTSRPARPGSCCAPTERVGAADTRHPSLSVSTNVCATFS